MTYSPIEQSSSLSIGTVDFVSPDEIRVAIEIDAPESVALNPGSLRPFPRVNGYLLVLVEHGFLVGQVEWITIERSPFPKRRGMQDFGLVDLPYPLRRLRLNPLGVLREVNNSCFVFRRGTEVLPTVGTKVLLPTEIQLRSIVESGEWKRVKIGSSPIAGDANVFVDPNRLFGRHLAILGNTGSGKSCSVAGLIRWSLEQATKARAEQAEVKEHDQCKLPKANARFLILDPNGEYLKTFAGASISTNVFKVGGSDNDRALKVPLWLWNSNEWCSLMHASARTQRPLLRRALREVKAGRTSVDLESNVDSRKLELRRYLSYRLVSIQGALRSGEYQTEESRFGFRLKAIRMDLEPKSVAFPEQQLDGITNAIQQALDATFNSFINSEGKTVEYYRAFTEDQVSAIIDALKSSIENLGGLIHYEGPNEDAPIPFTGTELADHLEMLATEEDVLQYVEFLIARIRTFISDPKIQSITGDSDELTLVQWLNDYIGTDESGNGSISIIDLSLVPTDVVHVITAVIARTVFEALQRYIKSKNYVLPTVLVMEEAHTFIRKYRDDIDDTNSATLCCQVFERIAREGRKFGLGLVLSSQRPSELSETVLSQCNTFLLHRISNYHDQQIVHRLVPDNLRGLLRELPTLPSQMAVVLGWAVELPVLVKMNDLPKEQQPRSDDPEFWNVWTGIETRNVNWGPIANEWQEGVFSHAPDSTDSENPDSDPTIEIESGLSDDD